MLKAFSISGLVLLGGYGLALILILIWNSVAPSFYSTDNIEIDFPDNLIYCDQEGNGICLKVDSYRVLRAKIFPNREKVIVFKK